LRRSAIQKGARPLLSTLRPSEYFSRGRGCGEPDAVHGTGKSETPATDSPLKPGAGFLGL
jgi:hypothetical protein